MNSIYCIFCNCKLNSNNLEKHLEKVHNKNFPKKEYLKLLKNHRKVTHFKKSKERQLIASKQREEAKELKEKKLKENQLQKIDDKFFHFENDFKNLKSPKYFEIVEENFNLLMEKTNNEMENLKINLDLIENIREEVFEYEKQKILTFIKKLSVFKSSIPFKSDFIKNECVTVYVFWEDITFDRNKIKISVNKAFVQPIDIMGSMQIYNEIKIEYFKRMYPNDHYKLIVHNGIVVEELSNGLINLRKLINEHLTSDFKNNSKRNSTVQEYVLNEMSKDDFDNYLNNFSIKNEYLNIPAKLIDSDDKIFGIIENNNGVKEEALLFIFQLEACQFILWENINPNRAGYLFILEKNDNINLMKIQNLIKTQIKYKRYNLFRNAHTKKVFDISCKEYFQLNHNDKREYENRLKHFFRKYRFLRFKK